MKISYSCIAVFDLKKCDPSASDLASTALINNGRICSENNSVDKDDFLQTIYPKVHHPISLLYSQSTIISILLLSSPLLLFSFLFFLSDSNTSVHCPGQVPTPDLIAGLMGMIIAAADFPIISYTKQLLKCTYCCDFISTQEQEVCVCTRGRIKLVSGESMHWPLHCTMHFLLVCVFLSALFVYVKVVLLHPSTVRVARWAKSCWEQSCPHSPVSCWDFKYFSKTNSAVMLLLILILKPDFVIGLHN